MWARVARLRDLLQRMFHGLRISMAAVDFAFGQLGLGAQAGERRLQLVRASARKWRWVAID